jgi:hypothetical protein
MTSRLRERVCDVWTGLGLCCCGHGNEPSSAIKGEEFTDYSSVYCRLCLMKQSGSISTFLNEVRNRTHSINTLTLSTKTLADEKSLTLRLKLIYLNNKIYTMLCFFLFVQQWFLVPYPEKCSDNDYYPVGLLSPKS